PTWHRLPFGAPARLAPRSLSRGRRRSRLAAALRVEVFADDVQIGDLAAEHAVERRAAAEQARAVGLAHPLVGPPGRRKEDLQRRVDAEQVRQPLEQMT